MWEYIAVAVFNLMIWGWLFLEWKNDERKKRIAREEYNRQININRVLEEAQYRREVKALRQRVENNYHPTNAPYRVPPLVSEVHKSAYLN